MKPPRTKLHSEDERPAPRLWPWSTKLVLNKDFKHSTRGHSQEPDTHRYTSVSSLRGHLPLGLSGNPLGLLFYLLGRYGSTSRTFPTNPYYFPRLLKQHPYIFILTGIVLEIWSLRFIRITQHKEVTHLNTLTTKTCAEGESFIKTGWVGRHGQ